MTHQQLHGLYAITPHGTTGPRLLEMARQALEGGARILQYRDKSRDRQRRLEEARALNALCRRRDATFIVNDDVELALACGAHGVHLGREDAALEEARRRLGDTALIGVSCYDDFRRAREAAARGADYVAFGAFFPSPTKPGAVRADPALLRRARKELALPVVAIGGITAENALPLIEAGAQMVAVIQGLFGRPDIRAAARRFADLFDTVRGAP